VSGPNHTPRWATFW